VVSSLLALAVSLLFAGNLLAADEKAPQEGRHSHRPMMEMGDLFQGHMLKSLNLTDDQKAKVEALKKEYEPKFKEGRERTESILTADQKKAREEAVKTAKAAGKKGPEVWRDAHSAMKLTDDQKAKMADARKANQALRKEAREKLMTVLTPEQKEQIQKEMKSRREHRPEGK
jgi:Spy/CpxP family protein refolding chaperone